MQELGLTMIEFARQVGGVDDRGKVRSGIHKALNQGRIPRMATLQKWAPVLQVDVTELTTLLPKPDRPPPITMPTQRPPAILPARPATDQFNLTIDHDGQAVLNLYLSISAAKALRLVQLLQGAGVFPMEESDG